MEYEVIRYKLAGEALGIAYWDMSITEGDIYHSDNLFTCSRELCRMLGCDSEKDCSIPFAKWTAQLHPQDKDRAMGAFAAHVADRTGKTPFDVAYRMLTFSGEYRYYHASGATLRDGAGVPLRAAGAVEDVTNTVSLRADIAQRDKMLDLQTLWYESVLNLLPFPVRVSDAGLNWTFVNDSAVALFGIKREDMLGKPCDHNKFCLCGTDNCSLQRAKKGLMQTFFEYEAYSYQVDVKIFYSAEGHPLGFIEIIHDVTEVTNKARRQADTEKEIIQNHADGLSVQVDEKVKEIFSLQNAMISTVADLVEFRDRCTGGHIMRTQLYMKALIEGLLEKEVYKEEISSWDIDNVLSSAQLHDMGKISISDTILNKPAKLTPEEIEIMKAHVPAGVDAIDRILRKTTGNRFLGHARNIIRTHHERWDGTGYTAGLKGEEIPLEGRIMAVADVYDALVSWRPYKEPYSHEEAARIIESGAGTSFDPALVEIFRNVKERFREIKVECEDSYAAEESSTK